MKRRVSQHNFFFGKQVKLQKVLRNKSKGQKEHETFFISPRFFCFFLPSPFKILSQLTITHFGLFLIGAKPELIVHLIQTLVCLMYMSTPHSSKMLIEKGSLVIWHLVTYLPHSFYKQVSHFFLKGWTILMRCFPTTSLLCHY